MNVITIIGNLGQDPELRYTKTEKPVTTFSVATSDGWGENKKTNWHRVKVWGKQAETCAEHLGKGSKVAVTGHIEYGKYLKNGQDVYTTEIVARDVEFLSFKEKKVEETKPADDDLPF